MSEAERCARAQAEIANRLKDEFLATFSHELRTPLTAILGWAHILKQKPEEQATFSRALDTIERNARVQAQILDDSLDVARIMSGKLKLEVEDVSLASVIESAAETIRPAANARGIRLELALDPAADHVCGDPNRLRQVIWNLLANAVKFTDQGGVVRVILSTAGRHAEITVADTGRGIDAAFLPHVFERFRQADASTTRVHGGLGLGLSIVRSVVDLHGGTVEAESPGPGRGSTFRVKLPLESPAAMTGGLSVRGPGTSPGYKALHDVRVLVVDDDPEVREIALQTLASRGAQVTLAASAPEALRLIESARPHVVLADVGMPREDGYSFIRKVRALANGGDVPAAAITAYARPEDREQALDAGFQEHLAKPVDPTELAALVARLAGRN